MDFESVQWNQLLSEENLEDGSLSNAEVEINRNKERQYNNFRKNINLQGEFRLIQHLDLEQSVPLNESSLQLKIPKKRKLEERKTVWMKYMYYSRPYLRLSKGMSQPQKLKYWRDANSKPVICIF